ncbi:MAG: alanine--tRNA ligase [Sphingobacteriales bacterium]|nr:alanine--tRNA ligase [Sphingobacteriales bacterium]
MNAQEVRRAFLQFFASKQHAIVPSAPIVVKNDPTLMFTNAGMNQFKDFFLGNQVPTHRRIADTQKCLRVSGKHNDLEEVGVDTYHHTMFEMLGNWSFGDYFKKEALEWSWELLTEIYGLSKNRLYVSVFGGDEKDGLPPDNEARDIWRTMVAEDHILYGSKKDNFWEMGDTGPCGPCSEIHIDLRSDAERAEISGKDLVNNDHPQVIEIWNNVFIQFERLTDGSLCPLPEKHVDTGMGFERLVRAIQGKSSNYDTDVFTPLIQKVEQLTALRYGINEKTDIALRVLSDHIRAISLTIADGQLPSNTGAGYVIRRILRRAVRYYYSTLQYKKPLLHAMVATLAEQWKDVFPELYQQRDFVAKVILEEENAFLRTLEAGLKRFELLANQPHISGAEAFELYDTFGFPLDLTLLMARESGILVDEKGFEQEMNRQKERSRAATALETGDWVVFNADNETTFVGYEQNECKTVLLKYRKVNLKKTDYYQYVLRETPFYAESGGQVGDIGYLYFEGERVDIIDTQKENNLILHLSTQKPEILNGEVLAVIDQSRRVATASNHSATHLLHAVLRNTLGTHVHQKGSLVAPDYLRFDFSHFSKVSDAELQEIEQQINEKIRENIPVQTDYKNQKEAIESGAMALFGEKYGDVVRVVTIDPEFSRELCGGTHVGATGAIGLFKFLSESSVAAGVRRIEAVSGTAAMEYVNQQFELLQSVKETLKNPKDTLKAVQQLSEENNTLKKELEKLYQEKTLSVKNTLKAKIQQKAGYNLLIEQLDVPNADSVKQIAFALKNEVPNLVAIFGAVTEGKAHLTVMVDEAVLSQYPEWNAATVVRNLAKHIRGGGGGQNFYATAGGSYPEGLAAALESAHELFQVTF